jgi:hypothetical protein
MLEEVSEEMNDRAFFGQVLPYCYRQLCRRQNWMELRALLRGVGAAERDTFLVSVLKLQSYGWPSFTLEPQEQTVKIQMFHTVFYSCHFSEYR